MRVLQERHYERVGGTATVTADVRLVAPTNRDLEQAVANGRFRDGLYFHLLYSYLAVFRSHLPPLRERGNDVCLQDRPVSTHTPIRFFIAIFRSGKALPR